MDENTPYRLKLSFPGNLEYVFPVRKLVYEVLLVNNFSQKFAYRSEVIVDEICSNAINYGCKSLDAHVEFLCLIFSDRMEVQVKDQGGNHGDIERLRVALKTEDESKEDEFKKLHKPYESCLGLEIVRVLSEEMDLQIDDNNITTLRVVRKRKSGNNIKIR